MNPGIYNDLNRITSSHLFDLGAKAGSSSKLDWMYTDLVLFKNNFLSLNLFYGRIYKKSFSEFFAPSNGERTVIPYDPPKGFHVPDPRLPIGYFPNHHFDSDSLFPQIHVNWDRTNPSLKDKKFQDFSFQPKPSFTPESFINTLNKIVDKLQTNTDLKISKEDFTSQINAALDNLDKTFQDRYINK